MSTATFIGHWAHFHQRAVIEIPYVVLSSMKAFEPLVFHVFERDGTELYKSAQTWIFIYFGLWRSSRWPFNFYCIIKNKSQEANLECRHCKPEWNHKQAILNFGAAFRLATYIQIVKWELCVQTQLTSLRKLSIHYPLYQQDKKYYANKYYLLKRITSKINLKADLIRIAF